MFQGDCKVSDFIENDNNLGRYMSHVELIESIVNTCGVNAVKKQSCI